MQPSGQSRPILLLVFFSTDLFYVSGLFFFRGKAVGLTSNLQFEGPRYYFSSGFVTFDLPGMGDPTSSYGTASIALREICLCFVYFIFYVINCRKIYFRFVYSILLCNKFQGNVLSFCILYFYVINFREI